MLKFLEKYAEKKPIEEMTLFTEDKIPNDPSIKLTAANKPHLIAISHACSMDEWLLELILADVHIGSEGCRVLCAALKNNNALKKLDLSGNFLQADSCRYLGDLLQHNSAIEHLLLELNNLGVYEDEFRLFTIGVGKNTGLRYLDMRNNQITSQGGQSFGESLLINNTIKYVDLRWNIIGVLASKYLVNLTNRNRHLLEMKLEGNDIPSVDLQLIYKNLDSNRMEFRFENSQHTHDRLILNLLKEMKDSSRSKIKDPRSATLEIERNKLLDEIIKLRDLLGNKDKQNSELRDELEKMTKDNIKLTEKLSKEMKNHDERLKALSQEYGIENKELRKQIILLERDNATLDLDLEKISFKCTSYIDELKILKANRISVQAEIGNDELKALRMENENLKKENTILLNQKNCSTSAAQEQLRNAKLQELQEQVTHIKSDYYSLKSKYKTAMKEFKESESICKTVKSQLKRENKTVEQLRIQLEKSKNRLKEYHDYISMSKLEKQKFMSIMGHLKTEIDGYCE